MEEYGNEDSYLKLRDQSAVPEHVLNEVFYSTGPYPSFEALEFYAGCLWVVRNARFLGRAYMPYLKTGMNLCQVADFASSLLAVLRDEDPKAGERYVGLGRRLSCGELTVDEFERALTWIYDLQVAGRMTKSPGAVLLRVLRDSRKCAWPRLNIEQDSAESICEGLKQLVRGQTSPDATEDLAYAFVEIFDDLDATVCSELIENIKRRILPVQAVLDVLCRVLKQFIVQNESPILLPGAVFHRAMREADAVSALTSDVWPEQSCQNFLDMAAFYEKVEHERRMRAIESDMYHERTGDSYSSRWSSSWHPNVLTG